MTVSSLHQLNFFLFSIAAGGALSFLYCFMAEVRRRSVRGSSAAADILFWAAAAATVIASGLMLNDGGIRGYQLFGTVCGFILHSLCMGSFSARLCRILVEILAKLLSPLFFLCRGIYLYAANTLHKLSITVCKIKQNRQKMTARNKTRKKIRKKYKKML